MGPEGAAQRTEETQRRFAEEALRRAFGSIGDDGHEWDGDPAAWVREQRSGEGQA